MSRSRSSFHDNAVYINITHACVPLCCFRNSRHERMLQTLRSSTRGVVVIVVKLRVLSLVWLAFLHRALNLCGGWLEAEEKHENGARRRTLYRETSFHIFKGWVERETALVHRTPLPTFWNWWLYEGALAYIAGEHETGLVLWNRFWDRQNRVPLSAVIPRWVLSNQAPWRCENTMRLQPGICHFLRTAFITIQKCRARNKMFRLLCLKMILYSPTRKYVFISCSNLPQSLYNI